MILDCQVHAYEADHPGRPWAHPLVGPAEVTGDQLIAGMDAAGVDAAILVSPWMLYRYDASYAVTVRNRYPGRIAVVKPVDIRDPDVGEVVADWAATAGAVAIRIFEMPDDPATTFLDRAVRAADRHGLPVNLMCFEGHDRVAALALAHPDCRFVLDHIGIRPPLLPPVPPNPFGHLPAVLELARFDNIAMKLSGLCTLSTQSFPFGDIREPVGRVLDAFGIDRCMWGTDWTRAVRFLTYREGVDAFRLAGLLSETDREAVMGGTAQRIYGWAPRRSNDPAPPSQE